MIEQIQAAVLRGDLAVLHAQRAVKALGGDPSALVIPCEGDTCKNTVTLGQSHSFLSVYATTGASGAAAIQCEDEQHYGCSAECAAQALTRCVREHLIPAITTRAGGQV